ncbi:MAG TPA: LuxR C-terminal-related transcriptional regulator [Kofleriaceae bacterium]|nr:LuxR C-terminal-related transcriptional regulator [Kofleriaceae bacterium]
MGVGKSDTVRFDELRHALRLVVELRDLPRGSLAQQRRMLEGTAALVGAQVAVWADVAGLASGRVVIRPAIDLGWASERERAWFLRFVDTAQHSLRDPTMAPMARAATSPMFTFRRDQLLDDKQWYGSLHLQELRRPARVDDCIYSAYATGDDTAACFSLHRAWGERRFTERERRLIELVHREARFLHEPPNDLAPEIVRGLSPRLRDALRGLARGLSEKQLAAELGISPHTAHDYAKALHRHFGVQSRSELLARCLTGR